MTPDRIIVHRDRISSARVLLTDSALEGCTEVITYDGHMEVTPRWPRLSSGERVLWRLLDDLTVGDLNEAAYRVDLPSRRALVTAITAAMLPESLEVAS